MNNKLDESLALCLRGEFDASEEILRSLLPDQRAEYNLGWHAMRKGDLEIGFAGMNVGRWLGVFGNPRPLTSKSIYQKDFDSADKFMNRRATILFHSEGGFGDQIANIRFARDFHNMGFKVIASCSPDLYPLFKHLKFIDGFIPNYSEAGWVFHDCWVPAMSAAYVLEYDYNKLQERSNCFVRNSSPLFEKKKKNSSGPFKIGIRWSGNPQFEHEQFRRFPVQPFLDCFKNLGKDISVYSFQKDENLVSLKNTPIKDLRSKLKTWEHTYYQLAEMDLVVSSCTSVAHLSASMGIPTWIIVPILPYYLWALPGDTSPWYPSVTLLRQQTFGSWDSVFHTLSQKLNNL